MICKNCGAEIKDTMKFCNKCGARTQAMSTERHAEIEVEANSQQTSSQGQNTRDRVEVKESVSDHSSTTSNHKESVADEATDSNALSTEVSNKLIQALASHAEDMKMLVDEGDSATSGADHQTRTLADHTVQTDVPADNTKRKSKVLAGLIGFFLGVFGLQWFYLGRKKRGFIYLAISLISATFVPAIYTFFALFCMAEALYLVFSKQNGYQKYANLI